MLAHAAWPSRAAPLALALALLAPLAACTQVVHETKKLPDIAPEDSCVYANDGVCDEPRNCALGSDSTDCDRACAEAYTPALGAACAYDQPPAPPLEDTGSHGTGGEVGTWDGVIEARGPQSASQTIDRYYRVYVPPSYDPAKPTPLLYVMGGFRVDSYWLAEYTELPRIADLNNVILVYLQAHWVNYAGNWVYQWYVYKSDWSPQSWPDNPDVDFVRRLTEHLKSLYNIDRTRIFASGHSRGAAEAAILAFEMPEVVAGFLSESGFTKVNGYHNRIKAYEGTRKVAAVLVHGTSDTDVNVAEEDATHDALVSIGYTRHCSPKCKDGTTGDEVPSPDFFYYRLPKVAHEWQTQYNQQAWDFLSARPLPLEMAAP